MADFQSTMWTLIRSAGSGRTTAVTDFVGRYRPAVVRFARMRGVDEAEAEDIAQEVFVRLFDDRVLERADPSRGRFRSMLLAVTRHVLGHYFERKRAHKRGSGDAPLPLSRPIEEGLSQDVRDPEFDREWVACLLAAALRRLQAESPGQYEAIHAFLVEERSQREVAAALERSEASIRNAVARGKARLSEILREEIQAYASSHEEMDDELAYLSRYLSGRA